MSLLTPDFGLLFWMVVSFAAVFGILAKYGFPVITKAVDERREYIRQSLDKADEAGRRLENMQQKSEELMAEIEKKRLEIIRQATVEAGLIIRQARDEAARQGKEKLDEALRMIEMQKHRAIGEIRSQVALLSVDIAGKILRRRLDDADTHDRLISALLDEIEDSDIIRN
ncbi:MAG: F0F1 ATP synthase subunit B [Tannerella sp.]|jgi:F-type H+-transporting ATPase subunit b|nr:F0F1 ATP synthase subunit B [Tannerella sp.]